MNAESTMLHIFFSMSLIAFLNLSKSSCQLVACVLRMSFFLAFTLFNWSLNSLDIWIRFLITSSPWLPPNLGYSLTMNCEMHSQISNKLLHLPTKFFIWANMSLRSLSNSSQSTKVSGYYSFRFLAAANSLTFFCVMSNSVLNTSRMFTEFSTTSWHSAHCPLNMLSMCFWISFLHLSSSESANFLMISLRFLETL